MREGEGGQCISEAVGEFIKKLDWGEMKTNQVCGDDVVVMTS